MPPASQGSLSSAPKDFTFDHIFPPAASQAELFHGLGEQTVQDVLQGYNGTVLCYGQTGLSRVCVCVYMYIYIYMCGVSYEASFAIRLSLSPISALFSGYLGYIVHGKGEESTTVIFGGLGMEETQTSSPTPSPTPSHTRAPTCLQ